MGDESRGGGRSEKAICAIGRTWVFFWVRWGVPGSRGRTDYVICLSDKNTGCSEWVGEGRSRPSRMVAGEAKDN